MPPRLSPLKNHKDHGTTSVQERALFMTKHVASAIRSSFTTALRCALAKIARPLAATLLATLASGLLAQQAATGGVSPASPTYVDAVSRSSYWTYSKATNGEPKPWRQLPAEDQKLWENLARHAIRGIEKIDAERPAEGTS